MLRYLLIMFLLATAFANAQSFVFVSSRTQIEADLSQAAKWQKNQNELFIYKNGSEIRLTYTNDLDEYDPSISPDGKLLAYLASSWVYPNELENSQWQLIISDLRGRQIVSFPLINSQESMRPAGGFAIVWLADSSGFYFNAQKPNSYDWDVYHFDIKTRNTNKVAEGFMPLLSPDDKLLATFLNDEIRVFDLSLDESWGIFEGNALAWYDEQNIFVSDGKSLKLVNVYSFAEQTVYEREGYYDFLTINESKEYAFVLQGAGGGSSLIKIVDNIDVIEQTLAFTGIITNLAFLADGSLVFSLRAEDSFQIYKTNDSLEIIALVQSSGDNYSPIVLKNN